MAFDENEIHGVNVDRMGMNDIGPNLEKMPGIDVRAHFGNAWAVQPGVNLAPQGPQMDSTIELASVAPVDPQDPHGLWSNNGPARDPLLGRVEDVSYNVQANCAAMSDGAGYAMDAVGNQMGELIGGVFDLFGKPDNGPSMDVAAADPRMAMNMQMQMRPGSMF